MGGRTYSYLTKPTVKPAYEALLLHPNFALTKPPKEVIRNGRDLTSIVDYVIESVAHFVSPPKVEGEHDELSCEDVANEIRTNLKKKILAKLKAVDVERRSPEDKEAMDLIHEAAYLIKKESNPVREKFLDNQNKELAQQGADLVKELNKKWTKITDSVKSLPPQKKWILVAFEREGGVVLEACYDGLFHGTPGFHLRDGFTIYEGAIAWREKPQYPKL